VDQEHPEIFETEAGPRKAVFRMKLLELTPDAERFRLFVPGLCALNGWAVPAELEEEIASQDGMPLVRPPFDAWLMEWIDAGPWQSARTSTTFGWPTPACTS